MSKNSVSARRPTAAATPVLMLANGVSAPCRQRFRRSRLVDQSPEGRLARPRRKRRIGSARRGAVASSAPTATSPRWRASPPGEIPARHPTPRKATAAGKFTNGLRPTVYTHELPTWSVKHRKPSEDFGTDRRPLRKPGKDWLEPPRVKIDQLLSQGYWPLGNSAEQRNGYWSVQLKAQPAEYWGSARRSRSTCSANRRAASGFSVS